MNRKLLNGLLVLAVAAGGVGTFTSCKDQSIDGDLELNQIDLNRQIDAIRQITDAEFKANLKAWLDGLTKDNSAPYGWDYDHLVQAAAAMYGIYDDILNGKITAGSDADKYIKNLWDWICDNYIESSEWWQDLDQRISDNADAIAAMQELIDWLMSNNASQVTSIGLSQTFNPVTGTVNLPIGLNSMLLATYVYDGAGMNFPSAGLSHLYDATAYSEVEINRLSSVISGLVEDKEINVLGFTDGGETGNMGEAIITLNPSNVDFSNIASSIQIGTIENGEWKAVLDGANEEELSIHPYGGNLNMGFTSRDGESENTGVYSIYANATEENWETMKVELKNKSELLSAIKDAIKDHSISDMAHLGDVIYKNLENIMPAYAVKVSWDETVAKRDENGNVVTNEDGSVVTEQVTNSVVSDFKLGVATVHPLAYTTGLGFSVDKSLPIFSTITEYFERYFDSLRADLHIDLGDLGGYMHIESQDVDVTIDRNEISVSLEGTKIYGAEKHETNGEVYYTPSDEVIGVLGEDAGFSLVFDNQTGKYTAVGDLSAFAQSIQDALNAEVANTQDIIDQVNALIDDINQQMVDLQAQVDSELDRILDRIHDSAMNKLDKADRLVEIYNKIASRVNAFLANPNHYLQVLMAYNAGDGMHHLSTAMASPTVVSGASKVGNNAGIEFFATSYNGDILVPSYKKYVAITQAWDMNGNEVSTSELKSLNDEAAGNINQVLEGRQQRICMAVSKLVGYKLQVTYLSLDYAGSCSMQQYYVYVKD